MEDDSEDVPVSRAVLPPNARGRVREISASEHTLTEERVDESGQCPGRIDHTAGQQLMVDPVNGDAVCP